MSPADITHLVFGVVGLAMGVGLVAIILEHFQNMQKIKASAARKAEGEVLAAIDSLRREVTDLRDTTTKYDVSFDTALQRLEERVRHLERRAGAAQPAEALGAAAER